MSENKKEIEIKPGTETTPVAKKKTVVTKNILADEAKDLTSSADIVDLIINKSTDELLPWEDVYLPSQGVYYDGRIPEGKIQVRPMGITADKIMATARLAQSGQALDKVYENNVKFPDSSFSPLDLLVGDRIFILFYLRGITHGNLYEFAIKCSNESCNIMSTHEYDLNKLQETFRGPKHPKEPVRITLPYLSKQTGKEIWVEVRFMRGADLQAIARKRRFTEKIVGQSVRSAKTGKQMSGDDENVILNKTIEENLNLVIVSVMGVTDTVKISKIIQRMGSSDNGVVRRFIDLESPGLDTEILVTCPECQNEMKMELPITETFFRPENHEGVRS